MRGTREMENKRMAKKYVEAKEFWNRLISVSENDWVGFDTIEEILSEMSAIDVVEVVRCGECKYLMQDGRCYDFADDNIKPSVSDYCSYGERGR